MSLVKNPSGGGRVSPSFPERPQPSLRGDWIARRLQRSVQGLSTSGLFAECILSTWRWIHASTGERNARRGPLPPLPKASFLEVSLTAENSKRRWKGKQGRSRRLLFRPSRLDCADPPLQPDEERVSLRNLGESVLACLRVGFSDWRSKGGRSSLPNRRRRRARNARHQGQVAFSRTSTRGGTVSCDASAASGRARRRRRLKGRLFAGVPSSYGGK